ncbi:MAG: 50S ribosomal protein L28 [Candidatus Latescibacteria bacterium]|jgi:large subunit ribosomal protein L28|nr:50S ribosomal protein L28 [Candidatus Latescibacterota bacterium]MBT4141424.1 50S ribosomal protein L28 [Candidatus Latescibacterota bacterium]MBT5830161.1 50S ribosomal protein L28 [Candidatus Latescibacterota bacterium]
MPRQCALTGKKPMSGNHVSHSKRRVRRVQNPNLQTKRIYVPELGRFVRIKMSVRALRTVNKKGLLNFLKGEGLTLKDVVS